ncbi:hypothetical protein ZIOFF_071590 [Zingiber officinale]|uniref:Uncharacterized protein n=1 Tax=Zingiber officinale TaxID=94328 RepID=A0A8J5C9R5_ZINOF|nr:hypothetical protein ZIOFF_071590 [Zingiber officinale]
MNHSINPFPIALVSLQLAARFPTAIVAAPCAHKLGSERRRIDRELGFVCPSFSILVLLRRSVSSSSSCSAACREHFRLRASSRHPRLFPLRATIARRGGVALVRPRGPRLHAANGKVVGTPRVSFHRSDPPFYLFGDLGQRRGLIDRSPLPVVGLLFGPEPEAVRVLKRKGFSVSLRSLLQTKNRGRIFRDARRMKGDSTWLFAAARAAISAVALLLLLAFGDDGTVTTSSSSTERMGDACSIDDIVVHQGATGPLPSGIPTYTVSVLNLCSVSGGCAVGHIHLSCGAFSSARLINPRVFRRLRINDCLLNDGLPMAPGSVVSFQYANSFSYPLAISNASCVR